MLLSKILIASCLSSAALAFNPLAGIGRNFGLKNVSFFVKGVGRTYLLVHFIIWEVKLEDFAASTAAPGLRDPPRALFDPLP